MFLEDELNKIYNEEGVTNESTIKMIKAVVSRIPNPSKEGTSAYINAVRRSDYTWHSFCKGKPELNPDGFRRFMLRPLSDKDRADAVKIFKWY